MQHGVAPIVQLLKNLSHGLDLMEHTGYLSRHNAAVLRISIEHRAAQTAQRYALQLLQRGPTLFQRQILPGQFVFQHPARAAEGAAGPGGRAMERPVTVVSLSFAFRMACL